MAIIYTYPSLSSLESQDSFVVTDVSDSNKTKKITLANVLSSEGLVQNKKITLTSAQILDLHNTPVELIPAPGVDKFIHVLNIYSFLDFNTTAYVTQINSHVRYRYGDGTVPVENGVVTNTVILQSTGDRYVQSTQPQGTNYWLPNENVQVFCFDQMLAGDSPINVYISYIIKDL